MPATIEPEKRDKLFSQIRHMLGAPIRGVELEDEMLDTAIELAILDWSICSRLVDREPMVFTVWSRLRCYFFNECVSN